MGHTMHRHLARAHDMDLHLWWMGLKPLICFNRNFLFIHLPQDNASTSRAGSSKDGYCLHSCIFTSAAGKGNYVNVVRSLCFVAV